MSEGLRKGFEGEAPEDAASFFNARTGVTVPSDKPAVAIIGYGAAGANALIALRCHGYEGPIRVFSNTATVPYSPILTSYYAGGAKSYGECFPWSAEELAELHAEVLVESPVRKLDPLTHRITTDSGSYTYTKCVIASGATPQSLGFPPTAGYEPLMLRTMDDAERLRSALEDPACKRVLVSGASMVALKMLEACLARGLEATLVGINPHVLDFNALPAAAERFERGLRAKGVLLKLGNSIKTVELCGPAGDSRSARKGPLPPGPPALRKDPGRSISSDPSAHPLHNDNPRSLKVGFADGSVDTFDQILVAHGMKGNLDFLPEPGATGALACDRGLLVDEFMRTSNPDVYAAGDVAQALELTSGQPRIVGIWKNAAHQGETVGAAIAAELAGTTPPPACSFRGSIPQNTIAVVGLLFLSAGTMDASGDRRVEVRESADATLVTISEDVCDSRGDGDGDGASRLVGFNLVCDHDEPGGPIYDLGAMLTMRIERACGL